MLLLLTDRPLRQAVHKEAQTRGAASPPTMRARLTRDCRDNLLSRCGATRLRPPLQRTTSFPPPHQVVSKAPPRELRQAPIPVATETRPTRFSPGVVQRQR